MKGKVCLRHSADSMVRELVPCLLVLVWIVPMIGISGCGEQPSGSSVHSQWTMDHLTLDQIEQLVAQHPEDVAAWRRLGKAYLSRVRYADAIRTFERAVHLAPNDPLGHYDLGMAYAHIGRYETAVDKLKRTIELDPDWADAYNSLGFAYGQLSVAQTYGPMDIRYDVLHKAMEAIRHAVALAPDRALFHYNLGAAYENRRDYVHAIPAYRRAVELQEQSIERIRKTMEKDSTVLDLTEVQAQIAQQARFRKSLGAALVAKREFGEAVQHLIEAAKFAPKDPEVYYHLGRAYGHLGKLEDAVHAYTQAIALRADYASAHFQLGQIYQKLKETEKAEQELALFQQIGPDGDKIKKATRHIELDPDDPRVHYDMGLVYQHRHQLSEAVQEYSKAAALDPDFVQAHEALVSVYLDQGNFEDALRELEALARIDSCNARVMNNLGGAYLQLGRTADAIKAFQAAINVEPEKAKAHCNLGLAYRRQDQTSQATEAFEQAIALDPSYGKAHRELGQLYLAQGDIARGAEHLEHALALDPNDRQARFDLSQAYLTLGRIEAAEEQLRELRGEK